MKTKILSCICITAIVVCFSDLPAKEPVKPECRGGQEIAEAVFNGDFDAALTKTQHCIEVSKADLEKAEREHDPKNPGFVDLVGLSEGALGTYLVAKAEILALKDAFTEADSALADAERFAQQHPGSAISWSMTGLPLGVARAFVLEKKGDLGRADAAYEATVKESKENGWNNFLGIVDGRRALIAAVKGDSAVAERLSKDALAEDATANVALAMVLEKKGDQKRAKEHYAAALKLMSDAAKADHWRLPVFFAEQQRVKAALK